MIQIRPGVFETNSSSTHSIVIPKAPVSYYPKEIRFCFGEYGWEKEAYDLPDYIYTAIYNNYDKHTAEKYRRHIEDLLHRHGIVCAFEEPKYDIYDGTAYFDSGYIDHGDELNPFLTQLLADDDLMLRALCGDSTVYTGNDNSSEGNAMCWCAKSQVWLRTEDGMTANPRHDPEHYDYYFKGN